MTDVISRKDANTLGLKRYFTGLLCPAGHESQRFVSTGSCCECTKISWLRRQAANRPQSRERLKRWKEKHPERVLELAKKYHLANPQVARESNKRWFKKNKEKQYTHKNVYRATKSGVLKKAPCSICGSNKWVDGHHEDYSKPLEVVWLCRKCHAHIHAEKRVSL